MASDFAPVFADLVRAFTTSEGIASVLPGAAVPGHQSFETVGAGERFYYSMARITEPGRMGSRARHDGPRRADRAGAAFELGRRSEASTAVRLDVPTAAIGTELKVNASGIGDLVPVPAAVLISGASLQPPAPVHLAVEPDTEGGLNISWVRRSRLGWIWSVGSDAPLGEEFEQYRLTISGSAFLRTLTVSVPAYAYGPAERAADGIQDPIEIEVAQIGSFAVSRPARLLVG